MIKYVKIDGNGNHFLVLDNRKGQYLESDMREMAVRDCNVKTSVGGDGILVVESSSISDFKMRIFNSNGFEGEMCGNGARCIALYAYREGIAGRNMCFETLAGVIKAEVKQNGIVISMGRIQLEPLVEREILMTFESKKTRKIPYYYFKVGVPHVVIDESEAGGFTLEERRAIGCHLNSEFAVDELGNRFFELGTNVNFFARNNEGQIEAITYERGVDDFTDSCGTGSCACALYDAMKRKSKSPFAVQNPGGVNTVYLDFSEDQQFCTLRLEGEAHYRADIYIKEVYLTDWYL